MQVNQVYNENCVDTIDRMPDEFIDLTVTSPPYDDLRSYKGYSIAISDLISKLYSKTKSGGVCVWIVGDQTVNGSETGNSFRQALKFIDAGWLLHDTMIYQKDSITFPEVNRYSQIFEYMFVFSKCKPKTTNIIKDRINYSYDGRKCIKGGERQKDGDLKKRRKGILLKPYGSRYNIWRVSTGHMKSTTDKIAYQHPAIFPETLAADHIRSWSNVGDLVYDPFSGSATTAKMAMHLNRNYIGSEISKEYYELGEQRLKTYRSQGRLF